MQIWDPGNSLQLTAQAILPHNPDKMAVLDIGR